MGDFDLYDESLMVGGDNEVVHSDYGLQYETLSLLPQGIRNASFAIKRVLPQTMETGIGYDYSLYDDRAQANAHDDKVNQSAYQPRNETRHHHRLSTFCTVKIIHTRLTHVGRLVRVLLPELSALR